MIRPALALLVLVAPLAAQEQIPEDAADLIAAFDEDAEALRFEAERKIAVERLQLARDLKVLQDKYTRAAKLDEAVAIRDFIRTLGIDTIQAEPAPPNVLQLNGQVGRSFYFKVTGNQNGSCYGTDVYTGDSMIATAAVHTGVLEHGEEGVVKVRVLPGRASYVTSTRNGVTSNTWSSYSISFSVEKVRDLLDLDEDDDVDPSGDEDLPDDPGEVVGPGEEVTPPEDPAKPSDDDAGDEAKGPADDADPAPAEG